MGMCVESVTTNYRTCTEKFQTFMDGGNVSSESCKLCLLLYSLLAHVNKCRLAADSEVITINICMKRMNG